MAGRRPRRASEPAPPPTVELSRAQFTTWLRDQIGDRKQEAFAADLGISRQALNGLLVGRRDPGARILKALKTQGLVSVRSLYTVVKPQEPQ